MPGPNGAEDEQDGHLLGMVYDGDKHRSSLVVSTCAAAARSRICVCAESLLMMHMIKLAQCLSS